MKLVNIFIFSMLINSICFSQKNDSLNKNKLFELSFGNSILFIPDSKLIDINLNQAVVLPTKSILFFTEFRPQKRFRIPVFFNLPIESKSFIVNNQIINERASPTFGTGIEFKIAGFNIQENSKIDFEIGPLASFLIDKNNKIRFAPVFAGRVRIMRGENFVMYIGASYSIGINALGLLYGTGTIF
jgi:hypothetical protein